MKDIKIVMLQGVIFWI